MFRTWMPVPSATIPATLEPTRMRRQSTDSIAPTASSYIQLEDDINFLFDEEDALRDHTKTTPRECIKSLKLDTKDGIWISIDQFSHCDVTLGIGDSVRMTNGIFLRIAAILIDVKPEESKRVVFRGHRLARQQRVAPLLGDDGSMHELYLQMQMDDDLDIEIEAQSLVDVPIAFIEAKKIEIRFTNIPKTTVQTPEAVEPHDEQEYFCRHKIIRTFKYSKQGKRYTELAVKRLRYEECDRDARVPDELLKRQWRDDSSSRNGTDGRLYTAVDGFCCAGGCTRGMMMAGNIRVLRAFDMDEMACSNYRINFPEVDCHNVDAHDYCMTDHREASEADETSVATDEDNPYIDIAHYSTPCQYFSPAHTRPGINDEANFAASFSLWHLLEKERPRIVTFENTAGLEKRHFGHLKAIFGQVTSLGYSLRFATINMADYGLPQLRHRLIMIASCPGEPLPTLPRPTHSDRGEIVGTLPRVTQMEAWNTITSADGSRPNHRPERMKKKSPPRIFKDLANTMTCSGAGANIHPEGRDLTICEYQVLQGFPEDHRFSANVSRTATIAQIGNAFPPLFVQKLMQHVCMSMQAVDGVATMTDTNNRREQDLRGSRTSSLNHPEIIEIDRESSSEDEDEDLVLVSVKPRNFLAGRSRSRLETGSSRNNPVML